MKATTLHLTCVLLVLGCTAASAASPPAAVPQEGERSARGAASIRFGDPEDIGYDVPFFPGASYDKDVPSPEAVLGQKHGTRLSHHAEILECYERWAAASPRVVLEDHGVTHEGRRLVHAVITSPANHERMEEILLAHATLRDARGLSADVADELIAQYPAIAWMGYSIHGDELSGSDAAVALGYHLAACTDDDVARFLEEVVVVIDPVMNPDGRERIISMVEQSAGYTVNLDYASMHRGHWPGGRGNHYLFDMNRDWMTGIQPETRGRWKTLLRYPPQLFVDAHEMGPMDTFLFYPQAEPHNPNLSPDLSAWQKRYAEDAAAAFDTFGWSYYTREWADAWGPFYSDAWGSLSGATGILYEQSNTQGIPLRRESGRIITYRETVHHQLAASWANLNTLAANRREVLESYHATMRRHVAPDTPGNDRMFVFRPDGNDTRTRAILGMLLGQGIEVRRMEEEREVKNARHALGHEDETLTIPAGSYIVYAAQPMHAMVLSYLDFDPRMKREDLQQEREDLERKGSSGMYDLTGWCLAHALALDAWWCDADSGDSTLVKKVPAPTTMVTPLSPGAATPVAWAVDGTDDASVSFAVRAMEAGLQVHLAEEPFRVGDALLPRGSLLVRRSENEGTAEEVEAAVQRAAEEAGVAAVRPAGTGLAPGDEADYGGQHFALLARPRVAVVANAPVSSSSYGHLWHHLDVELGVPFTILDAQRLGGADLRRYNVLILPPSRGSLVESMDDALRAWVRSGGTLIACGGSAAALTKERLGLSSVVLRRQALEDLEPYRTAARREREAQAISIDEAAVWGDPTAADTGAEADPGEGEPTAATSEVDEVDEEQDAWLRRFSPRGATVRGVVDLDTWLTVGAGPELPVPVSGSNVFLSDRSVRTAVRIASDERMRLGGLLWPEARERLAESAWLTVERVGHGQVILFATAPAFRGYHLATGRLFANAVVYGPGAGANQASGW